MSIKRIERILTAHYIPVMQKDGEIFALETWTENGIPGAHWERVTDWTPEKLFAWLGY